MLGVHKNVAKQFEVRSKIAITIIIIKKAIPMFGDEFLNTPDYFLIKLSEQQLA